MKILSTLVATVLALSNLSCKKDPPKAPESQYTILTTRTWKLTSIMVEPAFMGVSNILSTWSNCRLDDTYRFNEPDSLVVLTGTTLCDPSEPATLTGNWSGFSFSTIFTLMRFELPWESEGHNFQGSSINENSITLTEEKGHNCEVYTYTWFFEKQ